MSNYPAPFNVMMVGLPGSNKTDIARRLISDLKGETCLSLVNLSSIRRGLKNLQNGIVSNTQVWDKAVEIVARLGQSGRNIVLDNPNLTIEDRRKALLLLRNHVEGPWIACHIDVLPTEAITNIGRSAKGSNLRQKMEYLHKAYEGINIPSIHEGFCSVVTLDIKGNPVVPSR